MPDPLPDYLREFLEWKPKRWPTDEAAREYLAWYLDNARAQITSGESQWAPEFVGAEIDIDLRGAILDGMELSGAWLGGCDLRGVSLQRAYLYKAVLIGARLDGADLSYSKLHRAELDEATAPDVILRDADLRGLDARGAVLRGADLRGADINGVIFDGADLRGADLRATQFPRSPRMRGARLAGVRFDGADGKLVGPVDISETDEPELVDGPELERWLADHTGADVGLTTFPGPADSPYLASQPSPPRNGRP
ncbi:pentapeptide repeat-containing protein [Polymorphospora sp. NPDC050346]|uniref:pentapeptide repeat-containing protein n=1 Tax=Polymorphospora sp. NPDC050346 TaxID=3155780 RepID=UPI0033F2EECF